MRENLTLYYLLSDHLGSTTQVVNADGTTKAQQLYKAFGEKRFPSGASVLTTTFRFTGQRETGTGLYYFKARYYDPVIGRFASADTIIPNAFDPASLVVCQSLWTFGKSPVSLVGIEILLSSRLRITA